MSDDDKTNPKDRVGRLKPPLHPIPPSSLVHLGAAMANGVDKYGLMNWRDKRVLASVYYDAAFRHMLSWWDGEENSRDTRPPVHHLAHVMACCSILLDAWETGNLIDDRPIKGVVADMIDNMQLAKLSETASTLNAWKGEEPKPAPAKPDPYAPKLPDDWTSEACMPGPDAPRPQRGLKMICGELFFEGKSLGLVRDNLLPSELDRLIELVDAIEGHPHPGQSLAEARAELAKAEQQMDELTATMAREGL